MGDLYFAIEDEGGGAGHVDVIIGLAPLYVEGAAIHDDVALAAGATGEAGGDSGGAGTSAAGLGDAAATLPDTGADATICYAR